MLNVKAAALIVAGSIITATAAVAAPTITDHSYWPSASVSQTATLAGGASAHADDFVRSDVIEPVYQGGPHPR